MWASFTSGSYSFLKRLADRKPGHEFYFMRSADSVVIYYEHERKKSIFVSGKSYKITKQFGHFSEKGYVTMEHIPVTAEGAKWFQQQLEDAFSTLTKRTGVQMMRLLKDSKKYEYLILTQWKNKRYESLWKESPFYEEEHVLALAPLSAYAANRPFSRQFYMIEEDEEGIE